MALDFGQYVFRTLFLRGAGGVFISHRSNGCLAEKTEKTVGVQGSSSPASESNPDDLLAKNGISLMS